jgi:hypothetical protein
MVNPRQVVRPLVFALLLSMFSAASVSVAYGQFTLSVSSPFSPPEVDPGGTAIATLDIEPNGSSNPVTLTCVVTASNQQTISLPACDPSPSSPITPPAKPSLTVTTSAVPPNPPVPPGSYTMTVTGTDGTTSQTVTLSLTIVDITEDYTLSVLPTTATPSPVAAGASATTVVTVTPIGSYSGHQVTLACLSVSPVTTAAPVCSFTPTNGTAPGPVQVTAGVPATATLTITTLGPIPTTQLRTPRIFYALWLLVPGLALLGAGRSGNRRRRLLGLLLLTAIASGLLLTPACGSTNNTNNPNGETTPNNTYTFTLTGADENGNGPGNTITCTPGVICGAATVTLTVN